MFRRDGSRLGYCGQRHGAMCVVEQKTPKVAFAVLSAAMLFPADIDVGVIGIRGNTRFLISDLNNVQIADLRSKGEGTGSCALLRRAPGGPSAAVYRVALAALAVAASSAIEPIVTAARQLAGLDRQT